MYTGINTHFNELAVKILELEGFALFCQFLQFTVFTSSRQLNCGDSSCIKFCDPIVF